MENKGPIFHNVGKNRPLHSDVGCWVYFIREKKVVARSRAREFAKSEELFEDNVAVTYTGVVQDAKPGTWRVVCDKMELASHPFPHDGFQGFRYVRPDEQKAFEGAFRKRKK
jgi:hypothetical protein